MFTDVKKMINYRELKELHPKAVGQLKAWVENNLKEFQQNMAKYATKESVTIPEITEAVVERAAESTVQILPRDLYDFFDDRKIFVLIDYIFEEGFVVNLIGMEYTKKAFLTRREAEVEGFQQAFKILNEQ